MVYLNQLSQFSGFPHPVESGGFRKWGATPIVIIQLSNDSIFHDTGTIQRAIGGYPHDELETPIWTFLQLHDFCDFNGQISIN